MRHKKSKYQFNRRTAWRTATVKSLIRALFAHGSIRTTLTRAKAAQPLAEKLISWGKAGSLEKKRLAFSVLGEHALVKTLFGDIAPRFKSHSSGFTRILRLENRRGDDAQMALFQLTELPVKEKAEKHKKREKEIKGGGPGENIPAKPHDEKAGPEHPEAAKPAAPGAPEAQPLKKITKPPKKFLGGIRGIFKKERDSL